MEELLGKEREKPSPQELWYQTSPAKLGMITSIYKEDEDNVSYKSHIAVLCCAVLVLRKSLKKIHKEKEKGKEVTHQGRTGNAGPDTSRMM